MPGIEGPAEARPSFVTFDLVAEEDRTATITNGRYTSKDVAYAFITPQGSKDRIPRQADEWIAQLEQQAKEDRLPWAWYQAYKSAYQAWKEGRETPLNGTSVLNWPAASPAQAKRMIDFNIRTVEDMAGANEEAIAALGMGARALKQLALEWIASAKDTGKQAEEVAALKVKNEALEAANNTLAASIAALEERLNQLTAAPPVRQARAA